jgi:hypothetical protein
LPAVGVCISTIYIIERRGFELGAAAGALVPYQLNFRTSNRQLTRHGGSGISRVGRFEHFVGKRGGPAASAGVLGYWVGGESAVRASSAKGRSARDVPAAAAAVGA